MQFGTHGFHSWIHPSQKGSWEQRTTGSFSSSVVSTGHQSKDGGVGGGQNSHHTSHRSRFPAYIHLHRLKAERRAVSTAQWSREGFPSAASQGSITCSTPGPPHTCTAGMRWVHLDGLLGVLCFGDNIVHLHPPPLALMEPRQGSQAEPVWSLARGSCWQCDSQQSCFLHKWKLAARLYCFTQNSNVKNLQVPPVFILKAH